MRHTFSQYVCPVCRNRLTRSTDRSQDLFCLSCHTAVTIVDGTYCFYMVPNSMEKPRVCLMDALDPLSTQRLTTLHTTYP
jgi:uncharacterized protein YbaR (Trm112 family)